MKALLTITFLLCLTSNWAQNDDRDTVEIIKIYPFSKESELIPRKIKFGQRVKFAIHNVNTILLSADMASKKLSFDFEVPTLIKDALAKEKTRAGDKPPKTAAYSMASLQTQFSEELSKFSNLQNEINDRTRLATYLENALKDEVFIEDVPFFKKRVASYYNALYMNITEQHEAFQDVISKIEALEASFANLKNLYQKMNKDKNTVALDLSGTYKNNSKVEIVINEASTLNNEKHFKAEFEAIEKLMESLNSTEKKAELKQKSYIGIDSHFEIQQSTFISYTDSEQVDADDVTFNITLKNKEGSKIKELKPYSLRTQGGIKLNFSSGYLLNFKGDDKYDIVKDSAGSSIGIIKGNSTNLTHSIGALAHVYSRGYRDIQPGLSVGASLAQDGNVGFYLGGSLLFTEKHRFILTSGISLSKFKNLNTANLQELESGIRSFRTETDTQINFDEVYKTAFFIGITFNLSPSKTDENKTVEASSMTPKELVAPK